MSATFDLEHAHRLRESETEWLRQSAARIHAAQVRAKREHELLEAGEEAR
jgi:hypothetical protein